MERPSFTRQDTDAVVRGDEKTAYATGVEPEKSSSDYRVSKDSGDKTAGAGFRELPEYHLHDTEAAIGEGEIGNLESAEDIVTTVIHVDDDPTLSPWTFRMFFIGEIL